MIPTPILFTTLVELRSQYELGPESNYRRDIFPASYEVQIEGARVSATVIDDSVRHLYMFVPNGQYTEAKPLLSSLTGRNDWEEAQTTSPDFEYHFPTFDPARPSNNYWEAADGAAVALVQENSHFSALMVWIQTSDYIERLNRYRGGKA